MRIFSALRRVVGGRIARPAAEPAPAPRVDASLMLHQARSALLRAMPAGARCLLSAGCAGLWYFEWMEACYGAVEHHLGIEYYTPPPDRLPPNVRWIANTASDMRGVAGASCDLVFSGQNIEHLWPDEVAGFLVEARRVLRPGGHLVIDSPNRTVTRLLGWSHPEHTVELTIAEARQLLELAGFEITKAVGVWLCRDPRSGEVLPFEPPVTDGPWSMVERLVAATDRPDDSFIWWLEGRRGDRPADRPAIEALIGDIFRDAWPERLQRLSVASGHRRDSDGSGITVAAATPGLVYFGPYVPLRAGVYRVTFHFTPDAAGTGAPFARCDVIAGTDSSLLAEGEVGTHSIRFVIALAALTFGVQFRCVSLGTHGFTAHLPVRLEELAQ